MKRMVVPVFLVMAALAGCDRNHSEGLTTLHQPGTTVRSTGPHRESFLPAPPVITTIGNLQAPESALYDPEQDAYFISNINGGELAADGNGFITRVDAKTFGVNPRWIESGRNGVTLDGPKGMAVAGNDLYVADVTAVRRFDRRSGAPLASIPIPGATFVNDLTTDGRVVWASDTGLSIGPGTKFIRSGTDAIWRIENDRATKIASGEALMQPNGLLFVDGKLLVATFGGHEIYELSLDGRKGSATELPGAELDGIAAVGDGTLLVSSWKGDGVFRGRPGGEFEAILRAIDSPADIAYDARRHRLLIPETFANRVTVHQMR